MRAGRLRRRVVIQAGTVGRSATGEETLTYPGTVIATISASVETIGGREYFAAQAVRADLTHVVTARYRGDITPKMRAVVGGTQILDIESIADRDGRGRTMELLCREVVS